VIHISSKSSQARGLEMGELSFRPISEEASDEDSLIGNALDLINHKAIFDAVTRLERGFDDNSRARLGAVIDAILLVGFV
jgi:hypothetical protein